MAAGNTYTPIATTTLGSTASSYTFSSISGSYTDLVLVVNATGSTAADITLQLNSDTGTNYSSTILSGSGTAASSSRYSSVTKITLDAYGYPDTTIGTYIIQLQNYSNTTTYKTCIARTNNSANGVSASVGLWRSTSAISTILVAVTGGTFAIGSTFTLYGILAA